MKINNSFAWVCVAAAGIFYSCIITPQPRETSLFFNAPKYNPPATTPGAPTPAVPARGTPQPETGAQVSSPETMPQTVSTEAAPPFVAMTGRPIVEPERNVAVLPPIGLGIAPRPENIMGRGVVPPKELAAFLLQSNPGLERTFTEELAYIYCEESIVEGVNSDVAFAQMCLETGFLRFGGLVTADMNNFSGLGATGPDQRGLVFPNPRMGVRAHIQHLKAYATVDPLKQVLVDPRFSYVRRGSSPAIEGLAGTWASDLAYAQKIGNILERLYKFYYKY